MNQGRHGDFEQVMLCLTPPTWRWLVRDRRSPRTSCRTPMNACKYFAAFRGGSGRAWLLQLFATSPYSMLK
jgi:hypothetical protein